MRRLVLRRWSAVLAPLLVALPLAARAEAPPDSQLPDSPVAFVDLALHDTMTALAMPVGAAMPTRSEQLRLTITRYFDVAQLGRNSVGAAWQLIPPAQQADFLVTFENFLVTNYIGALTRPGELTFSRPRVINDAASGAPLPGDGRTVVRVDVQSSEGPPRPVLVALARRDDGSYRIVDVTAEAISLGNVLAADFSSFLRRNGGRLEALIGALHQKIASRANDR